MEIYLCIAGKFAEINTGRTGTDPAEKTAGRILSCKRGPAHLGRIPLPGGGRLRRKIENEGFNTQKCGGYEVRHKFARKSHNGMQNYYTLLQITHAINQFLEKDKEITARLKEHPKETLRNLWILLKGYMIFTRPPNEPPIHDAGLILPDSS
jgi:hypothetical protein